MLKLFSDKKQAVECKIKIEGAKYKTAVPRLVLKADERSVMFEGRIDKGKCVIDLPALNDLPKEGEVKLEVVVDGALFDPYSSRYEIVSSLGRVVAESVAVKSAETPAKKPAPTKQRKIIKEQKKPAPKTTIFNENLSKEDDTSVKEMLGAYASLNEMHRKLLKGHISETYTPTNKALKWGKRIFRDTNTLTAKMCMYEYENLGNGTSVKSKKSDYLKMMGL